MDKYHYTLHELHKRHCNFQIVRGKSTGTYRFTRVLLDSLDFQDKLDSTVLTREQVSRSKLEDAFSKRTGKIINETANTITVLPETAAKEGRGGNCSRKKFPQRHTEMVQRLKARNINQRM